VSKTSNVTKDAFLNEEKRAKSSKFRMLQREAKAASAVERILAALLRMIKTLKRSSTLKSLVNFPGMWVLLVGEALQPAAGR
jgi:hypothetical protein